MPISPRSDFPAIRPRIKFIIGGDRKARPFDGCLRRENECLAEESAFSRGIGLGIVLWKPNPITPLLGSGRLRPAYCGWLWRETLTIEALEEAFSQAHLPRARKIHGVLPGNIAVVSAVRRISVGLSGAIALPNAVGAVSMAGTAVEDAGPEHQSRNFGRDVATQLFEADFAVEHGHGGMIGVGSAHRIHCRRQHFTQPMAGLEHVEIEQRLGGDGAARAKPAHASGMDA